MSSKSEKRTFFPFHFSLFTLHLISRGEGPVLPISRKKFLRDGNCVTRGGTISGAGKNNPSVTAAPCQLPFTREPFHLGEVFQNGKPLIFAKPGRGLHIFRSGEILSAKLPPRAGRGPPCERGEGRSRRGDCGKQKTSPKAKKNLLPSSLFPLHYSLNIRRGQPSFPFEKGELRENSRGGPPPKAKKEAPRGELLSFSGYFPFPKHLPGWLRARLPAGQPRRVRIPGGFPEPAGGAGAR